MEPSPELRDLTKSLYQAMTTGDASFVTTFSRQPGVLCIGTDPAEWWSDYPTLERVMTTQLREMGAGGVRVVAGNPQAHQEGSVGWAADQPTIQMPDGTKMPARLTHAWPIARVARGRSSRRTSRSARATRRSSAKR